MKRLIKLIKMIFINYTFGINSMRKTCEEIRVNIAYRCFLGIGIYEDVPNYSTWSKNYQRRYKDSEVFDQIFNHIIRHDIDNGFIDTTTVFGDGTHRKATDKEVEIVAKAYEKALHYKTTNREGYRIYESNPIDCEGCLFLSKCSKSKKHVKTIARHVWEADHIRHTDEWKNIYPQRKETIERVFADAKEKSWHAIYTFKRASEKSA